MSVLDEVLALTRYYNNEFHKADNESRAKTAIKLMMLENLDDLEAGVSITELRQRIEAL